MSKKLEVKTWQIAFFLAAVVLITFLLVNCNCFSSWLKAEIPNTEYRTLCAGLILALVVFVSSGMFHHYLCPVKEKSRPQIGLSPLGVMER